MLKIEALRAFSDNYIWLLQNPDTRCCAVVDPGDAAPVETWLQQHSDWRLTDILVTHHHHDHVDGIEALVRLTGARVIGPARERIPCCQAPVDDGDQINVLGQSLRTLAVPGHTLGHVAYFCESGERPWVLCGDTLFAAGCGRLFEGSPEQMHRSLTRLAALPETTLVYCSHEYTLSNLRFALAVEPDSQAIRDRLEQVQAIRAKDGITLPTNIRLERQTNPFLRLDAADVRAAAHAQGARQSALESEIFAAIRRWKDNFR